MSNEHPDMHGNPADEQFYCTVCGREVREEDAYGCEEDPELLFCSTGCVIDFELCGDDDDNPSIASAESGN